MRVARREAMCGLCMIHATMSPMAARSIRHRLLGNPIVRTVLSVWAWLVLGVVIIVWVPLVAVVRLVTAPLTRGGMPPGTCFAS